MTLRPSIIAAIDPPGARQRAGCPRSGAGRRRALAFALTGRSPTRCRHPGQDHDGERPRAAALLALRAAQLPDTPAVRRHPPAHRRLLRRRRVRRAADSARCLPLRARRGDHASSRPAGQARRGRSTSWSSRTTPTTWASSPTCWPASPHLLADPTGKKWYDMIKSGQGAQAAIEIITSFSHGHLPEGLLYAPDTAAVQVDLARQHRGGGGVQRTRGVHGIHRLRVDLATPERNNLHRNVIFRDNGDKAGQMEPFTMLPPAGQRQPARPVEMDGRLRAEDRRATCWRSRTTATSATASCSR